MDKIKVLLVEDEENARKQLSRVILREGYDVFTAVDGRDGLTVFEKEKPSIVFTDLNMPNIDGMEFLHTIKRRSPRTQVIVITGNTDAEYPITAMREGVLDYLKKPLDLDQFITALGRAREKVLETEKIIFQPSILLAEDDEKTGERLSRVLKNENWKVFWVKDGEEALKIFKDEKIDIALLDINMPKKNGIQTLHELRTNSPDFEAIILTGYGDESNAIQALRDGAFNFIRKPIELDELIICIGRALDKLSLERSLKYRTRELELSKKLIASITSDSGIVFDTRIFRESTEKDFISEVLETLPLDIIVFDAQFSIHFVNENVAKFFDTPPAKIDETFYQKLKTMGVTHLTNEKLTETVNKITSSVHPTLERISTGEYSHVLLMPISLITESNNRGEILMILRGERK